MKTRTMLSIGVSSAFAAIALCDISDEVVLEAPMQTKSGKHSVVACKDPSENKIHVFNTAETLAAWRPIGRNTWKFTDLLTQQKKEILETKMDGMTCINVTPAMLAQPSKIT